MAEKTETPPANVVALHDLTGVAGIQRRRGRPRKIEPKPTVYEDWYYGQIAEDRARHIDSDQIVRSVRDRADAPEVLQGIRQAVAEEAAALQFQRRELEKRGRDGAQISSRRIDALVQLGKIELEVRKLYSQEVDLRGERFQRIFQLWAKDLQEVVAEVMSPQQVDVFYTHFVAKMENWENRAEEVIR